MVYINDNNIDILQRAINDNKSLNNFDTRKVTSMNCMFNGAMSFNQPLDNFDTSNVIDMSSMFEQAESFNQSLDNFDTSNVTYMTSMFDSAMSFNQPLDNFDTSKVTDMGWMFYCAESFNQPLDKFDTGNVINMRNMFSGATSMFIGYIMRFAARTIYVYKKYDAMDITNFPFSNSSELDEYIIHLQDLNLKGCDQAKIDSALDGFIID